MTPKETGDPPNLLRMDALLVDGRGPGKIEGLPLGPVL